MPSGEKQKDVAVWYEISRLTLISILKKKDSLLAAANGDYRNPVSTHSLKNVCWMFTQFTMNNVLINSLILKEHVKTCANGGSRNLRKDIALL